MRAITDVTDTSRSAGSPGGKSAAWSALRAWYSALWTRPATLSATCFWTIANAVSGGAGFGEGGAQLVVGEELHAAVEVLGQHTDGEVRASFRVGADLVQRLLVGHAAERFRAEVEEPLEHFVD